MQTKLEEIDVENSEYAAWDRNGAPVKMRVQKPIWLLVEPETPNPHQPQLGEALTKYAAAVGIQGNLESAIAGDFEKAFGQIAVHLESKKGWKSFLKRLTGRHK